ncbi:hypothetical protein SH139x_005459 [Planctomycetaceae bacterium SH139]
MNQPRRRPPQMTLSFMLMMNVVVCGILGAIYWASQVPAIRDEISMMFGGRAGPSEPGRTTHMIFLIFTYSAPLLLAGLLSTIMAVWRMLERRR